MNPANSKPKQVQANPDPSAANRATIPPEHMTPSNRETVLPTQQDSLPNPGERSPKIGQEFGRYQVLECLGQGAMGAVYKARDTQLDRRVALKIPKFSVQSEPGLLERFHREARSAATLSHPNICPVYDVGEQNGTHYISMGYIDGRPLSAFIKPDKPQPERKAAGVIRKLSQALEEAHRQGIIHRDLKSDNVMIDQRGQPIVMDFGLAQQSKASNEIRTTQGGQMLGTPAYMSPEQVDGDLEHIGPASDVYSLGVIFYELLTGDLPYQGSVASVLAQIIKGEPTAPSQRRKGLDAQLEAICLKMMAANREQRYQSMSEVTRALTKWLRGESTESAKPASTPRKAKAAHQESDEDLEALFSVADAEMKPMPAVSRRTPSSRRTPRNQRRSKRSRRRKARPWIQQPWAAWAGGGLAALLLLGIVLFVRVGDQTVKIEIDDPNAQVFVDGGEVTVENLGATVELKPGEHNLEVRRGDVVVQTDKFEVIKGNNPVLKINVVEPSEEKPQVAKAAGPEKAPPPMPASNETPAPPDPRVEEKQEPNAGADTPKRFVDRGDYVEDTKTGLLWQKDGDASGQLNFYQAADYAKTLKLGGLTAWRVPKIKELREIFPATNSSFQDTKYTEAECCSGPHEWAGYWTSELDLRRDDYAFLYQWYADGGANNCIASKNFAYVRCVHDPIDAEAVPTAAADEEGTGNGQDAEYAISRQVAEWALENRGWVSYSTEGAKAGHSISSAKSLPEKKFYLTDVKLRPGTAVTIADMKRLTGLPRLIALHMPECQITDEYVRLLQNHPKMFSLDLSDNPITDAGVKHLQDLDRLKHLHLNGTQITVEAIRQLKDLPSLTELAIGSAGIGDHSLDPLLQMNRLSTLRLNGSAITDEGVLKLKSMPNLWELSLKDTPVTDAAVETLSKHPRLHRLVLANTKITDQGLSHLKTLPELISLNISGCDVTNQGIIKHIASLEKLSELFLADTPLTDEGLDAISKLPNLRIVQFDGTQVTREGVKRFQERKPNAGIVQSHR